MSKAIITICGMIGATKPNPDKTIGGFVAKTDEDKAVYVIDDILVTLVKPSKNSYLNMLPLLVDSFHKDGFDIIAITTEDAKKIQEQVLEFEKIDKNAVIFESVGAMKGTSDEYANFFASISDILSNYEKVIIDLSHGFRHLPLLTLIALIVQNLKDKDNIKHILFAQEIDKDTKYKIIDLSEYLDIATVSYCLASFNKNYTAVNPTLLRTDKFKPLLESLEDFSEHILANSIQMIFEKKLIASILKQIEILQQEKSIASLSTLLGSIKLHLMKINSLAHKSEFDRLYSLGEILLDRGYLLNAITVLNEALPLYILACMNDIGLMRMDDVEPYQKASAVGNFIADGTIDSSKMENIDKYFYCSNYNEVFEPISILRDELRKLRNDLAHANGALVLMDIKSQMNSILKQFKILVIEQDIGKKLTTKINSNAPPCKMLDKYFIDNVTVQYKKYFKSPAPQEPFVRHKNGYKKFELILENKEPKEWNIPKPLNGKAIRLLKIMQQYEDASSIVAKQQAKDEFYRYFS